MNESGFEQHQRAKRARIETTKAMGVNVQSEYRSLDRGLASTSHNTEAFVNQVSSMVREILLFREYHIQVDLLGFHSHGHDHDPERFHKHPGVFFGRCDAFFGRARRQRRCANGIYTSEKSVGICRPLGAHQKS